MWAAQKRQPETSPPRNRGLNAALFKSLPPPSPPPPRFTGQATMKYPRTREKPLSCKLKQPESGRGRAGAGLRSPWRQPARQRPARRSCRAPEERFGGQVSFPEVPPPPLRAPPEPERAPEPLRGVSILAWEVREEGAGGSGWPRRALPPCVSGAGAASGAGGAGGEGARLVRAPWAARRRGALEASVCGERMQGGLLRGRGPGG